MKTTVRITSLALTAAFILGLASLAHAWGPCGRGGGGWGGGGGGGWGGGPGYAASAMTQEQRAKAQQVFSAHYAKMDPIRQQMITKHAELQALMAGTAPDQAKIASLSQEIGALQGKMLAERSEFVAQLQKDGLPMGGGMGRGMGGGMGRGMGGGIGCMWW